MDLEQLWTDLIQQLKSYPNVNASQIDAFFSRVQIQAASPGFVMLTADNDFIKDWVEKHYIKDIQQALSDLYNVEFFVQIDTFSPTGATATNESTPSASPESPATSISSPQRKTSSDQLPSVMYSSIQASSISAPAQRSMQATPVSNPSPITSYHQEIAPPVSLTHESPSRDNQDIPTQHITSDHLSLKPSRVHQEATNSTSNLIFDTFVIGDSNRMAYNMAVEVAERPGSSALNPLFIYGRSGVGKTHLLCAIKNYINEQYTDFNVCYIDSMELVNRYSDAAIEKSVDKQSFKNFENFFQQADVLLIDDIQGLQGKPGTLNALFRIFNSLIPKGKQFVFSADRAPKNIDLDERYVTRFNSGATIDIQPPDDETKRSIIKSFIRQYKTEEDLPFEISDEILDYIVENSGSNIRELKSAITNVIFALKMDESHELSERRLKELLGNHFIGGGKKRITIEMIQGAVEDFYGIAHKDLVGKKKERRIVRPRQVAIYLCRELSESTLKNIGAAFNRDHTTVMHSCDLINNQLQEDRNLREELEAIREKIRIQQY